MTTEYASVEDLTADEVSDNTAEVELPNGTKVLVRGMSRYELAWSQKGTEDPMVIEARTLSACMVAPRMTEAQVVAMSKAKGPMFVKDAVQKIRDLSGLGEGAVKSDLDASGDGERPVV